MPSLGSIRPRMLFMTIDIPICKDFIAYEEMKIGRELTYDEKIVYLTEQFQFGSIRGKAILEALANPEIANFYYRDAHNTNG